MHVVTWDCNEQPDWASINWKLSLIKGQATIKVVDTKSDHFAIVIGHPNMDLDEAQRFYDKHEWYE